MIFFIQIKKFLDFSDIWKSESLTQEDRLEIWAFFENFVTYAFEYKKKK